MNSSRKEAGPEALTVGPRPRDERVRDEPRGGRSKFLHFDRLATEEKNCSFVLVLGRHPSPSQFAQVKVGGSVHQTAEMRRHVTTLGTTVPPRL